MNKIQQLDTLDKAIKDAEIRLKSIQINIEKIDQEISVLGPRQVELQQNIEFHKKSNTVPIAHEYKKAKAELTKIKERLKMIVGDRLRADQACKDINQIIDKFKRDHFELLKTSENNVLRVLFGGNRGKR